MRAWGWALLVAAACSSGSGSPGAVLLVDATRAAGLDFPVAVGAAFPHAADAQQVMQRNMGHGVAVGDYDGDGDLDLYLLAGGDRPNRLLRNDLDQGRKTFIDVTPPLLADLGVSRVAHFVDLDNDGDLDLLLVNDDDGSPQARPSRIFRNEGGGAFTDATPGAGFRPVGYLRCGCALADYDRDGLLDVYVTNWGMGGEDQVPQLPGENVLYRNRGGLVFEDVTDAAGLGGLARDSFSAIFTDFDDDGFPDLYVAIDHYFDRFYRNQNGFFIDVTTQVGTAHIGNDMGAACADFDDDGDLDIYTTNITDPTGRRGTTQGNAFYVNRGDRFVDEAAARGAFDTYWGWGVEFVDIENDGDLDLVAVTGFDEFIQREEGVLSPLYRTPSVLLRNDGRGQFDRLGGTALDTAADSRALVAFDYDRDGDLDLIVTNHGAAPSLFENEAPASAHWLVVVLGPDAQAIGARVEATVGGVTRRRDVIAGRSYLAGTPSEVHFGLGGARRIDTLRVRWADGTERVLRDVASDQTLRLDAD